MQSSAPLLAMAALRRALAGTGQPFFRASLTFLPMPATTSSLSPAPFLVGVDRVPPRAGREAGLHILDRDAELRRAWPISGAERLA